MATSNVSPATEVVEDIYTGKVSTKVTNPFTRKEVKVTADFKLPQAKSGEQALNMVNGSEDDLVFWFNMGRRLVARQIVGQSLGFDLGSDDLNNLYKSFDSAMASMYSEGMSEERVKKIRDFILGEEKFAPLRDKLTSWTPEHQTFDFSQIELKKPSGKRGPKGKSTSESEDSDEA